MIEKGAALAGADLSAGVVFNIDKPLGITSFQVVKRVRGWSRVKKVGHAGTLDPLASGVLLVCVGKATKQVNEFVGLDKEYLAEIELGKSTSTDDREGETLEEKPVPDLDEATLNKVLSQFTGDIQQVPPMFSAIKKDGQRLYKLARAGKTIEREARAVTIHHIDLLDWQPPHLLLRVKCGKGTYIRSLARDIGEALKCGAHLSKLQRSAIGSYRVENAWELDDLKKAILDTHETL